jgi:hypothetical protein
VWPATPVRFTAAGARELVAALSAGTYERIREANRRSRLAAVTTALVGLRQAGADVSVALVAAAGEAVLRAAARLPRPDTVVHTLFTAGWAPGTGPVAPLTDAIGQLLAHRPDSFDVNLHLAIRTAAEAVGGTDALLGGGGREAQVRSFLAASTPRTGG